jgi:hypothetical protein
MHACYHEPSLWDHHHLLHVIYCSYPILVSTMSLHPGPTVKCKGVCVIESRMLPVRDEPECESASEWWCRTDRVWCGRQISWGLGNSIVSAADTVSSYTQKKERIKSPYQQACSPASISTQCTVFTAPSRVRTTTVVYY